MLAMCWPTKAEVLRAAEWEQPLAQIIAKAKQNVVQRWERVLAREQWREAGRQEPVCGGREGEELLCIF